MEFLLGICVGLGLGVLAARLFRSRSSEHKLARALLKFKNEAEREGHHVTILEPIPPAFGHPAEKLRAEGEQKE